MRRSGALEEELRDVHLGAHLRMTEVSELEEVAAYGELRGYEGTVGTPSAP